MRVINLCCVILAVILTIATVRVLQLVRDAQSEQDSMGAAYQDCRMAAERFQDASDFLTSEARLFVGGGDISHMGSYVNEVEVRDRRGHAIADLQAHTNGSEAIEALAKAQDLSDHLAQTELYALCLAADAFEVANVPDIVADVELSDQDEALSTDQKLDRARALVNSEDYARTKLDIGNRVQECTDILVSTLGQSLRQANEHITLLQHILIACTVMLLVVILVVILSTRILLLRPMEHCEANIRDGNSLEPLGALELRYVIDAYNEMYEENRRRTESLNHEAHTDALTGLLNRGSFDDMLTTHKDKSALLIVDVDNFKQFNDEYGHDTGDAVLMEVASTLFASFRTTDYVCRIGGDEFAVIMVNSDESIANVIERKVRAASDALRAADKDLPPVSISVGVAFGEPGCAEGDLFRAADEALYEVKQHGRDGMCFAKEPVGPHGPTGEA